LNQGKTLGIFQLESGGMRDLARQLHIDKFEEIIAVGALYRPGPMEMIPSFINRKHGKEDIEIDHPLMADILKETYGIIVYQEQVMQIAQTLANYSLGEGDVLRRAMGKKDKEEMSRQGEKFKQGALANHLSQETAMMIFDKVEKFASYGFNKSHATAYAYLTYVTSFLKANYTKEWMSALMTCDLDDLTKVAKHIQESQSLNIDILPPDVNESFSEFFPTNKGIRFSLGAIKGIGEGVVETIVKEREKNGFFTSLTQFIQCIDSKKVGKKATESLIDAGCFDFTGQSRAYMKKMLDEMHDLVVKQQKEKQHGIMDLFSKDHTLAFDEKEIKITVEDNKLERLKKEKELLGFYLTGHPLSEYDEIIKKLGCIPLNEIRELPHNSVLQAAFVLDTVQTKISKNQKKFAIIVISDGVERFELPVWADIYLEKAFLLEENRLLYGIFVVDQSEEAPKLSVRLIDDLTTMNDEKMMEYQTTYESLKKQTQHIQKKKKIEEVQQIVNTPKEVQIVVDIEKLQMTSILQLKKLFEDYAGSYPVQIHFYQEQRSVQTLWINHNYGISYTAEFEKAVRQFSFCLDVRLTK
ncbi:MAG: DNA polymerase III subunit alpha, partial [Chlamydiales bacterium]|nr:DNA polymerase III subunit alpha [Chlamydiales bacterium]